MKGVVMSTELSKQIDDLLKIDIVNRHSYFQLKYFIVGKEPTIQSKMWRCVRELQARRDTLQAMQMERLNTEDNIELVEIDIKKLELAKRQWDNIEEEENTILNKKEADIQIRKLQRQMQALVESLKNLDKKQKETEEEAAFFLKSFESLQKVEPLKPYDDLQEQTKYWNEKITQLINLKVLLHQPLDAELVQTALSLSDDCRIKKEIGKMLSAERTLLEKG